MYLQICSLHEATRNLNLKYIPKIKILGIDVFSTTSDYIIHVKFCITTFINISVALPALHGENGYI